MRQEPKRIGGLIEQILASFGLRDRFHGWQIVHRWPDIVGPEITRHARAVRFSEGILTVVVESDSWRQELEMQREHILNKIRALPEGRAVTRIIYKAGSQTEYNDDQSSG